MKQHITKEHKMGDCPYYENWLLENQRISGMYNSENNQICKECESNIFGKQLNIN